MAKKKPLATNRAQKATMIESERKPRTYADYDTEVKAAVQRAVAVGARDFEQVLRMTSGADPRLVRQVYDALTSGSHPGPSPPPKSSEARRLSASLPMVLPVPDPMWSQWWFSLDTVVKLANHVWTVCGSGPVAFLGAPTIGYQFAHCFDLGTKILDVDPDVVQALQAERLDAVVYDVANALPDDLKGRYSTVFVDPPWYPDLTLAFIARARELIGEGGFILCVIPSRLTRPGLIEERTDLLSRLLRSRVEVVALESECVHYRVPPFEAAAYVDVDQFRGREWRTGDVLVARVTPESRIEPAVTIAPDDRLVFSRNPQVFRVFLSQSRGDSSLSQQFEEVPEFSENTSTRQIPLEQIALWTTAKKGAMVRDIELARRLLQKWSENGDDASLTGLLEAEGYPSPDARAILDGFRALLQEQGLPERHCRRTTQEMATVRERGLSALAAQPSARKYEFHNDGFRLGFQRDRDRVLWSSAFSRLSNKTQVFSTHGHGQVRGRLSHSIEVMQLASTIAGTFGLDRDLTEAGALVHDIGHCPFGHAGEHALDHMLNSIDKDLGGFTHYEHGVDVVCWLEDMYSSPGAGSIPGLNLTPETIECIVKHTYHRQHHRIGQMTLMEKSKHRDLNAESCHLEGQAVRIADKVSYLISDLEDGILMGVFDLDDLRACRLFDYPPIDLVPERGETLHERFISQRRSILKVLMEDILTSSDRRLAEIGDLRAVRQVEDYLITFSSEIGDCVTEIWIKLQSGKLHKNERVVAANTRATRIVSDLLILYAFAPELVASPFHRLHARLASTDYMKWYIERVGESIGVSRELVSRYLYEHVIGKRIKQQGDNLLIPTADLVQAKDYVASLTNGVAEQEHRRHFGGAVA